MTLEPVDEL